MIDQNAKTQIARQNHTESTQIDTRAIPHKGDCALTAEVLTKMPIGWHASIPVAEIAAKLNAMGETIDAECVIAEDDPAAEDDAAADIVADASAYLVFWVES